MGFATQSLRWQRMKLYSAPLILGKFAGQCDKILYRPQE
nr:MAG TPA: hypothetical protein [Caudoviricetes sp.]